jgi:hypothetical protein
MTTYQDRFDASELMATEDALTVLNLLGDLPHGDQQEVVAALPDAQVVQLYELATEDEADDSRPHLEAGIVYETTFREERFG